LTNEFLVDNWEFNGEFSQLIYHFGLPGGKIERKLGKFASEVFVLKEGVLFVEGDLNIFLGTSIQDDDLLALVICLFPCVNIVEDVVSW